MPVLEFAYEDDACPYCRNTSRFDFFFYARAYYRCKICDLIYLKNPSTTSNRASLDYYRNKYHHDHAHEQEAHLRSTLNAQILSTIEHYKKPGRILDVGCGIGIFLKEAKKRGWDIFGIDPSRQSIEQASEFMEEAVAEGTLRELFSKVDFDVITSINVLDHMFKPWNELDLMKKYLKEDGLLYLRFPNGVFHRNLLSSLSFLGLKNSIQPFLIFHQYAFTPAFVRHLFSDKGFAVIHIRNARLSGADVYQSRPLLKATSKFLNEIVWLCANFVTIASCGYWLVGPSLEVLAKNK